MKLHSLVACWSLLLLQSVSAATVEVSSKVAPFKLEGIKQHYAFKAPVAMVITNTSSHPIMYGIGVERLENGAWKGFATNIGDHEPYAMEFGYTKIAPHTPATLIWSPGFYPQDLEARGGMYRMVIAYQVGDNNYKDFYSVAFEIDDKAAKK